VKRQTAESVVHHWRFYSRDRLAFGAIARRVGRRAVRVQVAETIWHAESVSLPERMSTEDRVRGWIRTDLEAALGDNWAVTIRFGSRPVPAAGVSDLWTASGKRSGFLA
jgi:hypothetical protein